jgi:bifunctional non-homologous end joining protein LigD
LVIVDWRQPLIHKSPITNPQSSILKPMLASLTEAPLTDPSLVYEPKYDGIRAIAEVAPGQPARLWSRLGNEKTRQFPEIAAALEQWSSALQAPVVLDGEIVALDAKGAPAGFQRLQGRINLSDAPVGSRGGPSESASGPSSPGAGSPGVALILFDILREGRTDLRTRTLDERRAALERLFGKAASRSQRPAILRISELTRGDGRELYARALASGWEGLIAKRAGSTYQSGKRTPDWRKLKIVHEQEFVVGGWTEPRNSRSFFGALLLGVHDNADDKSRKRGDRGPLTYVGHTGTGFDERELARLMKLLKPLETTRCPFRELPPSNERPHWVKPTLVAQVKFTEWTEEGRLRHPVYLGLRDDKKATAVIRERQNTAPRTQNSEHRGNAANHPNLENLVQHLTEIENARKDAMLELPDGVRFRVGNLHKVFWPRQKLTKGDLFRYYCQAAPFILPVIADRPLVMKRFPNGIVGKPFYQHHLDETATVPTGVRVELVGGPGSRHREERKPQFVGGALATLLYMTQLASISQDPWFSRVQSVDDVDCVALDLDPPDGVPFARVLDVARWIHDELDALGVAGFPKTSGADGLHIYLPMPPGTPYEAGQLFCQIIATVVTQKHPKAATTERSVAARGTRIYVDYLQNGLGKTIATAYSARASEYAGVSTPLTWREIDDGVRREDFTIQTVPARLKKVGDLWAGLRKSKGVDLTRVSRYAPRK